MQGINLISNSNASDDSEEIELHDLNNRPIFTVEPIPKELKFSGIENFLIYLPSLGYADPKYACVKLVAHFTFTKKTLKSIINELKSLMGDTQKQLTENYSKKLIPFTQTKTTENANLWRTRVILFIKQTKLKRKLELQKLDLCYYHISISKKLLKIIKKLMQHPRNVIFNINSITRLPQIIKTETDIPTFLKIKATEVAIADIKIASKFIPRIFTKPEVCATVIFNITKNSVRFRDPLTSYLPETAEAATFADFIQSKFSTVRYNENQKVTIDTLIASTVETLRNFAHIKETAQIQVLTAMSVRYWFNKILICNKEYLKTNPQLIGFMHSHKNNPLSSLDPPRILTKAMKDSMNVPINDFIVKDVALFPAIGELFMCLFYNSPVDVAFRVYNIHLRFAGFMSHLIKKNITDKSTLECVAFLWKVLLISADVPCMDAIFAFVIKYAQIAFIPQIFYEKCIVPHKIILKFQSQMK